MPTPIPPNETARLEALAGYALLDTPPEPEFDQVTALAAKIFDVPIALISLVDENRLWFKSNHGLGADEVPRDLAFCAYTILQPGAFVVPDATADDRFARNPAVTGPPHLRFYAGAPLATPTGEHLGALCLLDTVPRAFSAAQGATLTQLAAIVVAAITARQTEQRLRQEILLSESAANALRLVEARYQRVSENIPGMVYQFIRRADGAGEFVFVSETCRSLLGLEPAVLLRDAGEYFRLIHPQDVPERDRLIAQSTAILGALRWEGRHVLASGEIKWLQVSAQPHRAPNGDMLWDGVMLDATERKRAEQHLRMLESSVENANDSILVTEAEPFDEPGPRIIYVNKAFTRTTGYTAEEVLGKTPRILQGPNTSREATATIRRALKRWRPVRVEVVNYRKDGSEFWEELNIVPVANDKGWYTHWVSVQRDITVQKETEVALREAKRKAEEARAEAERANLAKSEFLSRMSHELRTPLNAILGFGQLLEMDAPTDRQRAKLSHILKGGNHLLGLINEVLDIARIESGQVELILEAIQVADVLNDAAALIQPLATRRDIHLGRCLGTASDGSVMADRQRLNQVVLNLLSNAVKYNLPGGSVSISCEPGMVEGRLRLAVTDTGPGIAPADLEKLFMPFERLGAERSTIEGTGIGLALSKSLVTAMGGAVGVDSTPGQGSTFYLELPGAAAETPAAAAAAAALPEIPPSGRPTVLYIEDNHSNFALVELALEAKRPDIRLLGASRGQSGLDSAREHRPDLILLDMHLPDTSGEEVLRELQAGPHTKNIPVIMVSAEATGAQPLRLLHLGARAYVTKPLRINDFLRTIDESLTGRTGLPSSADGNEKGQEGNAE